MTVLYYKLSRYFTGKLAAESSGIYGPTEIDGLKFHIPGNYIPCVELTMEFLRMNDHSSFNTVVGNLDAVYAVREPIGIGAASGNVFISSGHDLDDSSPVVWFDLIGYLVGAALVASEVKSGSYSTLLRWSSRRAICEQRADSVVSRLKSLSDHGGGSFDATGVLAAN